MSDEETIHVDRKHPLAHCESCPLNSSENAYVPSQFAKGRTALVVVGEAPGFQETAYKVPFKGPSGKLIRQVVNKYGYDANEVMYTNVVLCRPPDNATPPKVATNACRSRLLSEISESGANDLLALGGTATASLVDDSRSISALRIGPPKEPTRALDGSNVKRVIPTWHPAYCLRNADAFPTMVSDIGKLRYRLDDWREPNWQAFDDPADALAAIHELQLGANELVIDIEVGVDKDTAFDHPNEYDLLCVGIAYAKGRAIVLGEGALRDSRVRDELRTLLQSKRLVAHNGKFDLAGLYPLFGGLTLWFDTMLASYTLDERAGQHGLKVLAVEKLGAPKYDDEIKRYIPRGGNYGDIPRPILYKYNAMDVACTWALYEMFAEALNRNDLRRVHDHLVRASNELMYLELNGISVDIPYNFKLGDEYLKRLGDIEAALDDIVDGATNGAISHINPRSPKQVKEVFSLLGYSLASTNVDTLKSLSERLVTGSPASRFVSTLLSHRREQKLYGTYVMGVRKRAYRGRVYTTYLLHGTTSGRLASRNPNLQNIVRDKPIRRQFVASKSDRILIQADYKQAEGRVIATLAADEYLRSIFSDESRDIFDELSNQLYGVGAWGKEQRVRTKAFFYGLGYGRETASIAAEYKIPMREAIVLRNNFMELIPATVNWQNKIRKDVLKGEDLVTFFGRRRRFHLITEQNQHAVLNEALSFLPQSTASDICVLALIKLRPLLKGLGWIRLTIHDALVVETPEARREEVSELLQNTMVDCGREFTDYVPFAVDLSYGSDWGSL